MELRTVLKGQRRPAVHALVLVELESPMKSPQNPTQKRRPYDAPVLTRQSNLKSITLFTSYDGGGNASGGGKNEHRDAR